MAAAAILDFEENEKLFRRVVPRVKYYVHAKFCLDPIYWIEVIAKPLKKHNASQIFDRRRPSWILRKVKNYFAGLFLGSSSMSMLNFV